MKKMAWRSLPRTISITFLCVLAKLYFCRPSCIGGCSLNPVLLPSPLACEQVWWFGIWTELKEHICFSSHVITNGESLIQNAKPGISKPAVLVLLVRPVWPSCLRVYKHCNISLFLPLYSVKPVCSQLQGTEGLPSSAFLPNAMKDVSAVALSPRNRQERGISLFRERKGAESG